jgi:hypothetical protein
LLYQSAEDIMKQETSVWGTFFLAGATALALSFLLTGCASSHREPAPGEAATSWGGCDRSRMISLIMICRQTRTEPVSDLSR